MRRLKVVAPKAEQAGVILGTLRVPALLRVVGLTAHRVVGTNLVVGFALGCLARWYLGRVGR